MGQASPRPVPVVFLDASVLIAGALSASGASRAVVQFGEHTLLELRWTPRILRETYRNLVQTKGSEALAYYVKLVAKSKDALVPDVTDKEIARWTMLTDPKDAHVLAGAARAKATDLLTLDRAHLLTPRVLSAKLPFQVQTPAAFLDNLRRSLQA